MKRLIRDQSVIQEHREQTYGPGARITELDRVSLAQHNNNRRPTPKYLKWHRSGRLNRVAQSTALKILIVLQCFDSCCSDISFDIKLSGRSGIPLLPKDRRNAFATCGPDMGASVIERVSKRSAIRVQAL